MNFVEYILQLGVTQTRFTDIPLLMVITSKFEDILLLEVTQ